MSLRADLFVPTFVAVSIERQPRASKVQLMARQQYLNNKMVPSPPALSRDWIFIQLAKMWYVADHQWKLNQAGELFDLSDEMATKLDIEFYQDGRDALLKALTE